jgi:hypothetical protein
MWLQFLRLGERKSDEYLLHYRCYCRGGHRGAVLWDRVNVRKFVVYHGETRDGLAGDGDDGSHRRRDGLFMSGLIKANAASAAATLQSRRNDAHYVNRIC